MTDARAIIARIRDGGQPSTDDLRWFARDALPAAIVPYVRDALTAGTGPWISESGWG